MPDVIHTIAARLRRFVGNRRHVARHRIRLPLSLVDGTEDASVVGGTTREISESGVTFVVPSVDSAGMSLGGALQIVLKLPVRLVEMSVIVVRHERLPEGYLVGARITGMSKGDRAHYIEYMRRLSMKADCRGM